MVSVCGLGMRMGTGGARKRENRGARILAPRRPTLITQGLDPARGQNCGSVAPTLITQELDGARGQNCTFAVSEMSAPVRDLHYVNASPRTTRA